MATLPLPCLMLITERMESSRLVEVVTEAVTGGVNVVQIRNKGASPDELTRIAAILKPCLHMTPLLINGCASAAQRAGATGVHLPEAGPAIHIARRRVGEQSLVGRSVHSVQAAVFAAGEGADYLIAGTIFASPSHPAATAAGLGFLREVCAAVSVPVIAIGGITPRRAAQCIAAGAVGIAVLSLILHSPNPREAAAAYAEALQLEHSRPGI